MQAVTTVDPFPLDDSVKTLGWGVVEWIEEWLIQPDGDDAGEKYRLTREQLNFLLWFYAVDAKGRFTYRRAVLRRSKGWGKSPFLAAVCLAELCGPVRFSHWTNPNDPAALPGDVKEPVGKPHSMPLIHLAGVSEAQTQNTFSVVIGMLEGSEAVEAYGLDVGQTRIFSHGGGKLMPITASSSSQEGARPSFAILDETHHWKEGNGGWKLARVIRRNLGKVDGRSIETTNAHGPGEESVAEASYLGYLAIKEGKARADGLLYDAREAPSDVDLADPEQLLEALRVTYGDSTWVPLERVREEIWDPATPPEESRRFYLSQITANADSWVSPAEYDRNWSDDRKPLKAKQTVALGFDGSLTDDSTALVAVRVSDGAPFLLGLWEKPDGARGRGWEVDKDAVRDLVDWAHAEYDVVAQFCDYAYWETDVDHWRHEYGEKMLLKATARHAMAWDMRGNRKESTIATEALNRALTDEAVPLGPWTMPDGKDGAAALKRHTLNARRRPNQWGISFGKESRESPLKVDALAAWMLANMARNRVLGEGVLAKRKRVGRLVGFK